MRILHTIDSVGIYGAESVLLTLAGEQQRQGHEPILMSIGNLRSGEKPLEAEARRRGLRCLPHRMRDGLNLRGASGIAGIAAEQRIDVIHSHGYKSNILLGLMPRATRGRPVVATLHGWTAKSTWSKLGLYRFLDQRLLPRLDAVVLVSERLRSSPAIMALDPQKLSVIPNGIALGSQPDSHALATDPLARRIVEFRLRTGTLIGAVGRLSAEKNFIALVEALDRPSSRNARVGLALLGDGPELGALSQVIAGRGLSDRVLIAGYVPEARRYLGLFDVLAIPSLTEGLPIILLEGMSENLPVIATRVGDIPSVLGDLGLLVPAGDVDALADAIHRVATDPGSYRQIASGGFSRVRDQFSARVMVERYDGVYRGVLARI